MSVEKSWEREPWDAGYAFAKTECEDQIRELKAELNKIANERDTARHALKNALAERDSLQKQLVETVQLFIKSRERNT